MVAIRHTALDGNAATRQRLLDRKTDYIKHLGGTVLQAEGGAQCSEPDLITSCCDSQGY